MLPAVTYICPDGSRCSLDLSEGVSLRQGAIENAVPGVLGDCGGACVCATCHLYVDEMRLGELDAPSELEDELLNGVAAPRRHNSRLGCQVRMTKQLDGLVVVIPERQR